jgi:hypothetical protein
MLESQGRRVIGNVKSQTTDSFYYAYMIVTFKCIVVTPIDIMESNIDSLT